MQSAAARDPNPNSVAQATGLKPFDVVAKVRGITGIRDVGHAGTLDPFATGVLVLGLGRTRLLFDLTQTLQKTYRARVRLGQMSDTDDVDGEKTSMHVATPPTDSEVRVALAAFRGTFEQVPPAYAALKVKGRKMYELVRKGIPFERTPRKVTVYQLDLLSYAYPYIDLRVRVSRGTYIRAIARDLGQVLKTGAFLEQLIRERVGLWSLEDALDIEEIKAATLQEQLSPPEGALGNVPTARLVDHDYRRLAHGEPIKAPVDLTTSESIPLLGGLDERGSLQMLLTYDHTAHLIRPHKIIDERWL